MTDTTPPTFRITITLDENRQSVPEINDGVTHMIDTNPPDRPLPQPANDDRQESYATAMQKLQTWKHQIHLQEQRDIPWSQRLILKNCRDRIAQLEQRLRHEFLGE